MSIEERAREKRKYGRQYRHNSKALGDELTNSMEKVELACIEMAKEQRDIDIENMCNWLTENRWLYDQTSDYQFSDMIQQLTKYIQNSN